jgi:prolyl 4-hydroxylase
LIASDEPLSCPDHSYNTFILSHEPLMVYIEGFLSEEERKHLLKIRYDDAFLFFSTTGRNSRREIEKGVEHVTDS